MSSDHQQTCRTHAVHLCTGTSLAALARLFRFPVEQFQFEQVTQPVRLSDSFSQWAALRSGLHGSADVWRGCALPITAWSLRTGAPLAVNDWLLTQYRDRLDGTSPSMRVHALTAGTAGATGFIVGGPFEAIALAVRGEIQAQAANPAPQRRYLLSFTTAVRRTMQQQGLRRIVASRNMPDAVVMAGLVVAIRLGAFTYAQENVNPYCGETGVRGFVTACATAHAARAASVLLEPLHNVRRSMMIDAGRPVTDRSYAGFVDCAAKLVKAGGVRSMWSGALPEMLRGASVSVIYATYDRMKAAHVI